MKRPSSFWCKRPQDAPLHRLQAVREVRNRAVANDVGRVFEKAPVHAPMEWQVDLPGTKGDAGGGAATCSARTCVSPLPFAIFGRLGRRWRHYPRRGRSRVRLPPVYCPELLGWAVPVVLWSFFRLVDISIQSSTGTTRFSMM